MMIQEMGRLLKHASSVTGSGLLLEQIYRDAGLPEGLLTTLVISHSQLDDVIAHDLVRGVTLTGSPDAGRHVGEPVGTALKKAVLELGLNGAYLALSDADLETAVEPCVSARLYNDGETCIAVQRFVVVDTMYDKFRDAFALRMNATRLGGPTKDGSDIGPMAREDLRQGLHRQVK